MLTTGGYRTTAGSLATPLWEGDRILAAHQGSYQWETE